VWIIKFEYKSVRALLRTNSYRALCSIHFRHIAAVWDSRRNRRCAHQTQSFTMVDWWRSMGPPVGEEGMHGDYIDHPSKTALPIHRANWRWSDEITNSSIVNGVANQSCTAEYFGRFPATGVSGFFFRRGVLQSIYSAGVLGGLWRRF